MDHPHPATLDPIYAPGASAAEAALSAAKLRRRGAKLLVGSAVGFGLSFVAMMATSAAAPGTVVFLVATVLGMAGAGHSIAALVKGLAAGPGATGTASAVALTFGNLFMTGLGAFAAFLSTVTFTRGRQIRSAGKILLPPVETGDAWTGAGLSSSGPVGVIETDDEATRAKVAAQWRENGRTEHASVAAFARLTLDLMALGAPPELVADANRDALDEIRHAELCFGLARAIDGRIESPGAFPAAARARTLSRSRTLALAQLAVDSLVDGALHEGVSARIIAKLARRCEAPAIQGILKEIAADEGRHARHGWDVVRWCLAEGGDSVAHALEGALRALPKTMSSPMPDEARDGRWECWGIMGEELEAEEHEATRVDLERRVAQAIAATRQATLGYGNVSVG
ncbi:MAG: hypothetical protein JWP87_2391 [Labilithrix sp.]|nr:hypothetical protein [Labilithrix sp.]